MNLPWEAILALVMAIIGFIAWLTKISVYQDIALDKIKDIKDTTVIIEATYVKGVDFSRELGRVDNSINAAHKRIDDIKRSGYNINKELK